MIILSHRGYWHSGIEKNSQEALFNSLDLGFGLETDLRDFSGDIVVSHDVVNARCFLFRDFAAEYRKKNCNLPLALNIKADGLQIQLKEIVLKYEISNYFLFDMSVPDMLVSISNELNCFTRISEYETNPCLYDQSVGVWMDEFKDHWIDTESVMKIISDGKQVCIVSPELHGRAYMDEWEHYLNMEIEIGVSDIMLCTDFPEKASDYFSQCS